MATPDPRGRSNPAMALKRKKKSKSRNKSVMPPPKSEAGEKPKSEAGEKPKTKELSAIECEKRNELYKLKYIMEQMKKWKRDSEENTLKSKFKFPSDKDMENLVHTERRVPSLLRFEIIVAPPGTVEGFIAPAGEM